MSRPPRRKDKYLNHRPPDWVPPLEEILSRADMSGGRSACWPWTGYHHLGRPLLYVSERGSSVAVARLIGHHFRPLSRRETMLPQCGTRGCVNPSHLELTSVNSRARLSEYERTEIVRLSRGGASQHELAQRYGVSQPAIHYILATRGGLTTPRRNRTKKANP